MPKAGGTFVERAIEQSLGYKSREKAGQHYAPLDDPKRRYEDRYAFTVIRNPIHWIRSVFNWLETGHEVVDRLGRVAIMSMAHEPLSKDRINRTDITRFDKYVRRYLDTCPGIVTCLYNDYVARCASYGRIERVQEDMIRIFDAAGEAIDPLQVYAHPVSNSSESKQLYAHPWETDTLERFIDAEMILFEKFYPEVLENCGIINGEKVVA